MTRSTPAIHTRKHSADQAIHQIQGSYFYPSMEAQIDLRRKKIYENHSFSFSHMSLESSCIDSWVISETGSGGMNGSSLLERSKGFGEDCAGGHDKVEG